jgi:riboflavin kinase/FMN adenylyltransferase
MTALTIGMFDGVHLGHQALIRKLRATGLPTTLVTFEPHPLAILRPPAPRQITPPALKAKLLTRFGIDQIITLPFTQKLAATSFDQFLDSLSFSHLILGKGDAFGYRREGTEPAVRAWAKPKNIQVEYIPKLIIENEPVSSTRIRQALEEGDVDKAERLLGWSLKELSHVL